MKETPVLKTERLTLRPFVAADAPQVYAWCSSLTVTRYLFWHPHRDLSVSERLVASWIRKKRNYSWALDDGDGAIGEVQLIKDLPDHGFELGYILLEEKWHQGYMKEALAAVLNYLFLHEDYLYSYEETDAENLASRKLLESFGYRLTAIREHVYIAKKDVFVNVAEYRLDQADFLGKDRQGKNDRL
jgi:ribosomal-protein-alanine N-acetyltransferase